MSKSKLKKKIAKQKEEIIENKEDKEATVNEPEFYEIKNSNRLRLRLEEDSLFGCSFKDVEIDNIDLRTKSFAGCKINGSKFVNVVMQGCDLSKVLECDNNVFIDRDWETNYLLLTLILVY